MAQKEAQPVDPAVEPSPQPAVPSTPVPFEGRPQVIVMEMRGGIAELSPAMLDAATDVLRIELAETHRFTVISREQTQMAMATQGLTECYDTNCLSQLAQSLSAAALLRSAVNTMAGNYVLSVELIDLATDQLLLDAELTFDGTEQDFGRALGEVSSKMVAMHLPHEAPVPPSAPAESASAAPVVVAQPESPAPAVVTPEPVPAGPTLKKLYYIQMSRCTGCRECIPGCPVQAIALVMGKAVIDPEKCVDCGLCAKACSFGAPVEREVKR